MILSTAPATILVAITSLEVEDAKQVLTWAIHILSHPNDTIIAFHVLVGKEPKKLVPKSKDYKRFRRAKSFVLSVMGEFAETCQRKQVHLEARVRYNNSSIESGLIEEVKRTTAEFLVLRGTNFEANKKTGEITKYCMKNAPKGCSIISIGQLENETAALDSKEILSSTRDKSSPRTVLDAVEEEEEESCIPSTTTSTTEEDDNSTSSFGDLSTNSDSSSVPLPLPPPPPPAPPTTTTAAVTSKHKESPLRRVASFFLKSTSSKRRNHESLNNGNVPVLDKLPQPCLKYFSYHQISQATNHFHPDKMVGQGGYSEVYRGDLEDGSSIAVKRLTKDNTNPLKEKEFLIELGIMSQVSHPNTASLIGYCIETGLYLIFPFSSNGNLFDALHGKGNEGKTLEWALRQKIVIGIAQGLHYLHKCCKHRIIHRDIKASNVLLGPDYEPQITDFGLAKWVPSNNKSNNEQGYGYGYGLPIEGTFGYLAPEYFLHGVVDEKTDVFAFGILLLEIVTGRIPIDSSKQSLLLWAMPFMECGNYSGLVDSRLEGDYDEEQLHKIVLTASFCVRHSSVWRPSMTEVLDLLSNGEDSEVATNWGLQKTSTSLEDQHQLDDYSMVFGYNVPIDKDLQKAIAALELM